MFLGFFLNVLQIKNIDLICISIQTLSSETQNWAQVHPVSIDPPVVNSVDWTWFGKVHTCLYEVPQLTVHVRAKTKPWGRRNCLFWDRIMSSHRSGEGYQNISAALKELKNTVASIILKLNKFGTIKTLPRAPRPAKLSNWVRWALVRVVT